MPAAGTTRPCSPIGRGSSLKHCQVQVQPLPGVYALVAQLAEATPLNTAECWFESSRGHFVAVAQGARAPLWYSGDPGATPGGDSIHLWRRSLRAGLKHRRCRCDTCRMDHLEGQADWRRPPSRKRASASLGRSTRPPSANLLSLVWATRRPHRNGRGRLAIRPARAQGYTWVWCSGSTPRLGRGGRWFDPSHPDHNLFYS